MYFDLSVKERIEDFYNYREELNDLMNSINAERVIAVKGLRRVGKSSIMSVASNLINIPNTWIDARNVYSKESMHKEIEKALNELVIKSSIKNSIKSRLKEIEIYGITLTLKQDELERRVKSIKKAVLFVDEAQLLAKYGFDQWLSYAYDRLKNIAIVLAGSQIGLLDKLLGKGVKGKKHMRGRKVKEISIKPLSNQKAISFLLEGFHQIKKEVELKEVEEAVDTLGGLIGWLTMYGHERSHTTHKKALEYVKQKARDIVIDELESLFENVVNKKAYLYILKAIALNSKTWKSTLNFLTSYNIAISKGFLTKAVQKLKDYSFIETKPYYYIPDPLVKEVIKEL